MASVFIPPKTIHKMTKLGISESQVMDVFNSGEHGKFPSGKFNATKKYSGSEIGICYFRDETGRYVLYGPWTRKRR